MIRTFVVSAFVMAAAAIGAAPVAAGGTLATTNTGIDALAPNQVSPSKPVIGVKFDLSEQPLTPVSQQNAVRAAEQYLDYTGFSREGLIQQLEFDDFSTADATFAVDYITVDWNEQAAKVAEQYLDYTSFSRGGLIQQLEFDGFTSAQAAYGVATTGL